MKIEPWPPHHCFLNNIDYKKCFWRQSSLYMKLCIEAQRKYNRECDSFLCVNLHNGNLIKLKDTELVVPEEDVTLIHSQELQRLKNKHEE